MAVRPSRPRRSPVAIPVGERAASPRSTSNRRLDASDLGPHPVLDASPAAVLAVDPAGLIRYANPISGPTFGWEARNLIGKPIELLIPARLADQHVAHRRSFAAASTARPMGIGLELSGRRRDGSEFPVEISLAPVDTPAGRMVYATVIDISARKSLERQLLQAQKMETVGRLAGGIAHDFNNMLFAIRGHAALLSEDLDPDAPRSLDLNTIRRSVVAIETAAERAAALTAQLLAFSRQQVVRPVAMNLTESIRALEPMLQRLIGADVRLVLKLDADTGILHADPSQLDQVLVNLVVNARDAMPDGGTITIESGNVVFDEPYAIEHFEVTPGEYVLLAVSDTGVGMDRETRLHVFEPFFTTKEPGKGTGLGLATIYGIVRQAGGHIWLYSEPGRGTKFKLYFPQQVSPARDEGVPVAPEARAKAGAVLLVDDEPAVRDLTQQVLERAGYEVLAPVVPMEALAIVEPGGPAIDVLVTDLVMPGVSGRDLALRTMAARPETAIVLLSGYSADNAQIADLVSRGAAFASKPLSTKDLLRVVDAARAARGWVP